MKWISHITLAASVAAVTNPILIPGAVAGATAPDWLEHVLRALAVEVRHRGITHIVSFWILGVALCWFGVDYRHLGLAFFAGGLSHVLCDALTISGVPFYPWSDRRFHLFGGRLKTGSPGEMMLVIATVMLCILVYRTAPNMGGFNPWFPDWHEYYDQGVASEYEWKQNRFRFF